MKTAHLATPSVGRRRRRGRLIALGTVAALSLAAAIAVPLMEVDSSSRAVTPDRDPVTARVEWGTLTRELRLNGRLSFGNPEPLLTVQGMLTALPSVGQSIQLGEQVYAADGSPVVLFMGSMPFWRDLSTRTDCPAARPCADVAQLQQNLIDLGYLDLPEPSGVFGNGTRLAVRAWQQALGVRVTGEFAASAVVVAPSSHIRIAEVTAALGESQVSPATINQVVLQGSAALTDAQARDLDLGTPVTVTLRDGTEVAATLSALNPGGESIPGSSGTTPPTATFYFPDQKAVAGVGETSIRITVLTDGETGEGTLIVPATALLATVGGGYAVEVWDGMAIYRVPVEIGLVADARVQILGGDLSEGDLVVLAR